MEPSMHCKFARLLFILIGIAAMESTQPTASFAQRPATAQRPVVDTYHGVSVTDPYRWLEDDASAEVKAWSDAQNAYARGILDRLPAVSQFRSVITGIMSKRSPSYWDVQLHGGKYFAMQDQPPKQQPMIIV